MLSTGVIVEERRKLQRRHLYFYSRVFDEETHKLAGRLVDISREGMMLVSDRSMKPNSSFRFKLVLPNSVAGKKTLILEAHSRWSQKTSDRALFDNGFELVNVSDQNARVIDRMVEKAETDTQ